MSSPFGHSLAGYIIAAFISKTFLVREIRTIFLFVFIAIAPDFDFIPGILIGIPNYFHHGISHSFGVGALVSVMLVIISRVKKKQSEKKFLLYFSIYCSHLFLDYISLDGRLPLGIPVFWPFSNKYYISPYLILPPIMHSAQDNATLGQFLNGVFSIHNLYVILLETIVMSPVIAVLVIVRLRQRK